MPATAAARGVLIVGCVTVLAKTPMGWSSLIMLALVNLIENAAKFSAAAAGVEIVCGGRADGLEIAVLDRGIGVAADTVDKYLTWGEPPAQVEAKIKRATETAAVTYLANYPEGRWCAEVEQWSARP